jgi:hypothetical protein
MTKAGLRNPRRVPRAALGLAILGLTTTSCSPSPPAISQETLIPASDYAFQIPSHLAPGPTRFRLQNNGRVPHEMALGQLRAGITADSVLARLAAGGDPTDLTDGVVGILIAGPGATSIGSLSADLLPGRTYMMICQFRDADSLPPHIAMGMQASFVAD